tara:strand:+ start:372 stop:692 length:321 start_codon:yes stop_codon:yes gene_type:complete
MIKYKYSETGLVCFSEQHSNNSYTNGVIRDGNAVQSLINSGVEIAPYIEPSKSTDQLRAEVIAQLNSLDPTIRMLTDKMDGDQWAIDKIAENKAAQVLLREKLAAL